MRVYTLGIAGMVLLSTLASSSAKPKAKKVPNSPIGFRKGIDYQSPCQSIPSELPVCPQTGGAFQLLPEHFPSAGLYIGYASGIGMEAMLRTILEALTQHDVRTKLNIMFPRDDSGETFRELYELSKLDRQGRFLNFIPARSDESLWAQDYFIAGTVNGRRLVIADLPYTGREGETIPEDIALGCRADYVDLKPYPEFKSEPGDYGGNIEPMPGGFLAVGNTLSKSLGSTIKSFTKQDLHIVKVDWLETGHADEIITVVPDKTQPSPCNFALLYASPNHALQIVNQNPQKKIKFWGEAPSWQEDMTIPHPDYAECLTGKKNQRCKNFIRYNKLYDEIIQKEVKSVYNRVVTATGCKETKILPLPQLFYTEANAKRYGGPRDKAQALNPNLTNLIAMDKFIVVADQAYLAFQNDVERTAAKLGLQTVSVDAAYYHHLGGGLHCISTVQRACSVPIQ